jgi:hypothetical protein
LERPTQSTQMQNSAAHPHKHVLSWLGISPEYLN